MDAADQQKRPVDGETQDVARVVEVEGLRCAGWEGPVERGEGGGCVAQWGGAIEALDEAVTRLVWGLREEQRGEPYLIGAAWRMGARERGRLVRNVECCADCLV